MILSPSCAAALGNSTLVTTSRSFPVIVSSAPAFTGLGATTASVGLIVTNLPIGTTTPERVVKLIAPSAAAAGSATVIVLPSDLNSETLTASKLTVSTRLKNEPVIVIVSPALAVILP